jgi:hypothetical protein
MMCLFSRIVIHLDVKNILLLTDSNYTQSDLLQILCNNFSIFIYRSHILILYCIVLYYTYLPAYLEGCSKSLARPGRKQATATEDFEFHISYF